MVTEQVSDEDLLRSFLEGNQSSFAELMRRHEDRVFSLSLRMMGDRADALDATQEAFISAFRQARNFRFDAAFGTWLYRIGVNSCHDLLRKRKRWGALGGEEQPEQVDRVASDFDTGVTERLDVAEALSRLPQEYREAVVLHDLGGVPYDEIASITETPIGTVKSRISRGRKQLASLLEHPRVARESNPQ
jgi:RNA polymerase sigma-70 factor, ECF subfamily